MDVQVLKGRDGGPSEARVSGKCVVTGQFWSVRCEAVPLVVYMKKIAEDDAPKIQDVFPNMPADAREWLLSGISPEGWKRMFR